jgi:hypothetical protein
MLNTTTSFTSAVIQLAESEPDGTKRRIPCSFRKFESKRLQLESSESLKYGCAISVEYNDALFLGDVVGCTRTNGTWDIEVQVKQVLSGLQSLITLRDRLLGESVRVSPVETREAVLVPVKTSAS